MIAMLVLMRRRNPNYLTDAFEYTWAPKRSVLGHTMSHHSNDTPLKLMTIMIEQLKGRFCRRRK